ncbi:unnamed protein product [Schistosoma turkestanicum]|nr:unnamed protein product [Schistosoma turkestanicum]
MEKGAISSWSKEKLEDQYLRLYDDYLTLKKHACKQEERIKKMATKILRLAGDRKESDPGGVWKEDYQEQIEVLERKNAALTRKLTLVQNQLNVQKQRIGCLPNSARKASSATFHSTSRHSTAGEKPVNNAANVIQMLRFQNSAFEKTVQKLSEQLKERDELIGQLKQDLEIKEKMHTNDLFTLGEQVTSKQRIAVQENIDLIRTQRELREKQLKITNLEARVREAESNYDITKSTNRQLVSEIERLTRESSQLEQKLFRLESDSNVASKQQLKILELQYALDDAKRENQAFKESNEKLIANALSAGPEQQQQQHNSTLKEQKLRGQINHLEMMVHNLQQQLFKKQVEHQRNLLPSFNNDQCVDEEQIILNNAQLNKLESVPIIKQGNQSNSNEQSSSIMMTTPIQMFAQITGFTVDELEDAIMVLRERKSKSQTIDADLPINVNKYLLDQNRDPLKELNEAEALHADTIAELEKTRKLLSVQYNINKDYQVEIKELTDRLTEFKSESDQRISEYGKLLNIRADRIKQLENQLHDLAYGSSNKRKNSPLSIEKVTTEDDLEPGESLIELHIGQLQILPSVLHKYQMSNKNTDNIDESIMHAFLTWDFYDFETQATPIVHVQHSIDINMTVQYPVEVNDTLMNYLLKEPCTVEMYQVINSSYRTIAVGKLDFSQLFSGKDDTIELKNDQGGVVRRQGQLDLLLNCCTTLDNNSVNIQEKTEQIKLGTLDYWIRLCTPMADSIKLYKQRFQQLPGLISTNHKSTIITNQCSIDSSSSRNLLTIEIIKITNLLLLLMNNNRLNKLLPSSYFVYQFYDQLEYASKIISDNYSPVFNDHCVIPVEMDEKLDHYLRTENLKIYIVDSADPSPETSCLGIALIPLIGLVNQNQQIDGVFEIIPLSTYMKQQEQLPSNQLGKWNQINENSHNCGLLYVKMYWKQPYIVTHVNNNSKPLVYNQTSMEESNDLEMEPVKQVAEKPYVAQQESPKKIHQQSTLSSTSHVSFAKPVDKLYPSDKLSHDTVNLDQIVENSPEKIVHTTDNQIPVQSNNNNSSMINKNADENLSSSSLKQTERGNPKEKSIVPTPHPRTKTSELNETKLHLTLNNSNLKDEINLNALENTSQNTTTTTTTTTTSTPINKNIVKNTDSSFSTTTPSSLSINDENHVKIELHGLQLTDLTSLSKNHTTLPCQIFVEYSFLGCKEPFETGSYPLVEWKDNNDKNILKANFYYSKLFPVDYTNNYERRQYLASYLLPEDPNNGNLMFIIVSEPSTSTTQSAECEEIGCAMINLREIIQNHCDIDHVFIPITAMKTINNDETQSLHDEIGRLCASFHGLAALQAIIAEMPQVKLAI